MKLTITIVALFVCFQTQMVRAQTILTSVREFTGSDTAPSYVAEYSLTGTRIQNFGQPSKDIRDLTVENGNIYLYNGTFNPTLAMRDISGTWSLLQGPSGWSTKGNLSYGGVASLNNAVFAADMMTYNGGEPAGIIKFDLSSGTSVRFASGIEPNDIASGCNSIYALAYDVAYKYNPDTFSLESTVRLPDEDTRAIAVANDGSLFTASWDGKVRKFASDGKLLSTISVGYRLSDIDIDDATGTIAIGTADGMVVVTSDTLKDFTSFRATDSLSGGDVFVEFSQVPEPSTCALLAVGGFLLLFRRK